MTQEIDQVISEYYLDKIEIAKQLVDKRIKDLDPWGKLTIDFEYFNELGVLDYYFEKLHESFTIDYDFNDRHRRYNSYTPLSTFLGAKSMLYHIKTCDGEHKLVNYTMSIENAFLFINRLKNKSLDFHAGSYKGKVMQIYIGSF